LKKLGFFWWIFGKKRVYGGKNAFKTLWNHRKRAKNGPFFHIFSHFLSFFVNLPFPSAMFAERFISDNKILAVINAELNIPVDNYQRQCRITRP